MDRIHIVTATNNLYAKPLAVMLTSLFTNKSSLNPVTVHIIDGNISKNNKIRLSNCLKKYPKAEVEFVKVDASMFQDVQLRFHLSKETYYRIAIPRILSNDIQKAIYLDCDMIVKDDITTLWNLNLDDYFVAAVNIPGNIDRFMELSIPRQDGYFNAGMLVINVQKWREANITGQVLNYMKYNPEKLKLMDQDALNAILHDKWLRLKHRWNYQVHRSHLLPVKNPAIIHFTTGKKPWNSNPRYKYEYMRYRRKTVWLLNKGR
ncbi:glycosyltransferase family 8 protein [Paenibacillus sp. BR2-3]|uniref:glycosyltransferase family 8 protein n=1 Tax=Paenibacillus sp. BR2-3 TaxID=3048494 RepID=UPI0039773470